MGPHNLPINIGHYAGQLYSNRRKQPVSLDNSEFGVIEDGKWASLPVSVFHGSSGGGWVWIAARRRRETTAGDGMDGRAAKGVSLRKPTGSQASRLTRWTDGLTLTPLRPLFTPTGRLVTASGTPEPMACRSKTPRPSESGTPLCHGAGGCAGRIVDPFRTGAGSMSPAWTVTE